MKLSIIIPVFNEENTISKVVESILELNIPGVTTEIIIVDDASTDNTKSKIKRVISKIKNVKYFYHTKNQGKGAAIKTGIVYATGDYIIIQDADLEYNPQDIKRLVHALEKGKQRAIYGTRLNRFPHLTREERKGIFLLHFLGNRFLSLLTSILYGQWITDMETCYKLFPCSLAQEINLKSKGFEFEAEITAKLIKKGFQIIEVPIVTTPRGYDEGKKLHTVRDGLKAMWAILKYKFIE